MKVDAVKTCFVIMPFSETRHGSSGSEITTSASEWMHIYEKWIKRAVESYPGVKYGCKRSPAQPGSFIRGIVQDLAEADLVIADLTGGRPNVYYELGIRHALKLGTVIVTQHLGALPSDLNGYYAFEYSYNDKAAAYEASYAAFAKELHDKLDAFNRGDVVSDSPVSDFLGFRAYLLDKKGSEDKQNLRWLVSNCRRAMKENYHTCEFLFQAFVTDKEIELENWPVIDTWPIESLLTRLSMHQWHLFPDDLGGSLSEVLREHRKLMLSIEQMWQVFRINPSEESTQFLLDMLCHVCEERKPLMEESWAEIETLLDGIGLSLVLTDDEGEEKIIERRDFEEKDF